MLHNLLFRLMDKLANSDRNELQDLFQEFILLMVVIFVTLFMAVWSITGARKSLKTEYGGKRR